jgi:hypothetical protein
MIAPRRRSALLSIRSSGMATAPLRMSAAENEVSIWRVSQLWTGSNQGSAEAVSLRFSCSTCGLKVSSGKLRSSVGWIMRKATQALKATIQKAQADAEPYLTKEMCKAVLNILGDCLLRFKNPIFGDEEEWRLVLLRDKPHLSTDLSEINYRSAQFGVIPYVKCTVSVLSGRRSGRLPIEEVVQGPRVEAALAAKAIKGYLIKSGYKETKVQQSAVPLRF